MVGQHTSIHHQYLGKEGLDRPIVKRVQYTVITRSAEIGSVVDRNF